MLCSLNQLGITIESPICKEAIGGSGPVPRQAKAKNDVRDTQHKTYQLMKHYAVGTRYMTTLKVAGKTPSN